MFIVSKSESSPLLSVSRNSGMVLSPSELPFSPFKNEITTYITEPLWE